jgi:RNA polymerase sigma-70 factor (ECF subfamily)
VPLGSARDGEQDRQIDELARRVAAGDLPAWRELYQVAGPPLHRHAHLVMRASPGDVQRVEDVVQDSWIKALHSIASYDTSRAFMPWMRRVITNTARDQYRVQTRRRELLTSDMLDMDEPSADLTPEQRAELQAQREEILAHVNKLPSKQREVVILHFWEGLDTRSIAEIVDLSEGNVRVVKTRAIKKLRQFVNKLPSTREDAAVMFVAVEKQSHGDLRRHEGDANA